MELRNYQERLKQKIITAWDTGHRNVLATLATGGGKTVIFSSLIKETAGYRVVIAHRKEILGQISLALAKNSVPHSIIGPERLARDFSEDHRDELGGSWIDPRALVYVASVDTVQARQASLSGWAAKISLWVQDEAHHLLEDNKWGRTVAMFRNALGLGVTATPIRADGRSLKRGAGGVFDTLVSGVSQRSLINNGYLSDYRIFAPLTHMDLTKVKTSKTGDYNQQQLSKASKASAIVGDVVTHYKKIAPGERGVTFAPSIDLATDLASQFRLHGVPAAQLSSKSPKEERGGVLRAFKGGEILQLVNVDLFGEGFDLPALGVVSFARPTLSYGLYAQQFGRVLRPFEGKTHGKIIDHVGNVFRHGVPDRDIVWTLEAGRVPRVAEQDPPIRTCPECFRVWEGYRRRCPYCGNLPQRGARVTVREVEGDLMELDAGTLASMRKAISVIDAPTDTVIAPLRYAGAKPAAIAGLKAKHRDRQKAQVRLREVMAQWGGYASATGVQGSSRYIKFYHTFGVDVLSAQGLGRPQAEILTKKITEDIYGTYERQNEGNLGTKED